MSLRRPSEATSEHHPAGLRVAMALYGVVTHDSRVLREAETLARAGHSVTIYCLSGTPPEGAPFRTVARVPSQSSVFPDGSSPFLGGRASSLRIRLVRQVQWIVGYAQNIRAWGRWAVSAAGDVDVWHAHDLTGLMAVGPAVRAPCRLVYDSHEMFLETGTAARLPGPLRRLLSAFEGLLVRRAALVVTVNDSIAAELTRRYRPRRIAIVRNCPPRWTPPDPPEDRLRQGLAIPADSPVVLFHGIIRRGRGIEAVAAVMRREAVPAAHLVLLGSGELAEGFRREASQPAWGGRLHVLDPVSTSELPKWVASADVGVVLQEPIDLNLVLSSPNKLFECLASGTPVVASDLPEIRRVVCENPLEPLGRLADPGDEASIEEALRDVLLASPAERQHMRGRCLAAAHRRWNWEHESAELLAAYPR